MAEGLLESCRDKDDGYVLIQIIPVVLQAALVAAPVLIHFHEELQEDGFLEELLYVRPCQRAYIEILY